MSWWNDSKTKLPDKLANRFKDKTPEQVEAEFDALDAKAQKADSGDVELNDLKKQLQDRNNEFNQLQGRLNDIEANNRRQQAPQEPTRTSVLVDEDRAFAERLAPLAVGQLQQAAAMARTLAQQELRNDPRHKKLLEKYGKDVDAVFAKIPLQSQGFVESYRNAFFIGVGPHMNELFDAASKREGDLFTESGGGTPPAEPQKPDKLSDEELKIASRMRVTPEQYLKRKKSMSMVGA